MQTAIVAMERHGQIPYTFQRLNGPDLNIDTKER